MKKFLLILVSGIVSITASPAALMATDNIVLSDLNNSKMTETIPIVEEKVEPVKAVKAPATGAKKVAQTKNYTVSIFPSGMILDCGNSICKTDKLLYAHNSANLFGNLNSIANGEIFTVTENGVVKSYRVAEKVVYEKNADGQLNNNPYLMGNIVKSAMGHSIALMTCTGTSYGNGDASHRLVVYADAV